MRISILSKAFPYVMGIKNCKEERKKNGLFTICGVGLDAGDEILPAVNLDFSNRSGWAAAGRAVK